MQSYMDAFLYDTSGSVEFTNLSGTAAVTSPSAVTDHGDGSYEFTLTAGLVPGSDLWELMNSTDSWAHPELQSWILPG